MKIVINQCYGGFNLSPLAIREYAKAQGKTAHFYKHEGFNPTKYTASSFQVAEKDQSLFGHVVFDAPMPENLTDKQQNEFWGEHVISSRPEDRSDPILIQVIERIGVEAASGSLAELGIVEIPDGVKWHIEEYDGIEHIAEDHRTWP